MINYKGTPLFGPDSNVQHTSEFFAIAGTVLFWLIFLIFSLVIKPQPKKQYKEVQIVLSSTPVVQKTEEPSATAEQAAAPAAAAEPSAPVEAPKSEPVVETPLVKETPVTETPQAQKIVETPKTQTKVIKPAKPKEVPVTYAEDPMEAFAKQTKKQPKKEVDWDAMFGEDTTEESQPSNQQKTVQNNEPAFSGSAGTAASKTSETITSQSSSGVSTNNNVSDSTSKALEGIKNSTFKGNAANGLQSESTAKTKTSGSGKVEMEMSNGRSRALVSPASPVINLSAQAAATIDTSKTVSINFKVLEAGNVTEIKITPESILTAIVRDEIKTQISQWLFEAADYTATATFEYKIVKQ